MKKNKGKYDCCPKHQITVYWLKYIKQ